MSRPALLANENVPALMFGRAVAGPLRQQPRRPEDLARDVLALLDRPEFALGHLVVMSDRRMRRRALPA